MSSNVHPIFEAAFQAFTPAAELTRSTRIDDHTVEEFFLTSSRAHVVHVDGVRVEETYEAAEARVQREADIAVLNDSSGIYAALDDRIQTEVVRKLGWSAFTDEALGLMADAYRKAARDRDEMNARNRAIHEAQNGGRLQ